MSERLIVSVDAPAQHPDLLRVEEAFEHIVELFELATASSLPGDPPVIWKLISVHMNSPLTVVAEAVSLRPGVDVDSAARTQKRRFVENVGVLRQGGVPAAWSSGRTRAVARRFIRRSREHIGDTKVTVDPATTLRFAEIAPLAENVLVGKSQAVTPKAQIGSVEGYFLEVTTHYHHPAIRMRERRTGREIWCLVSEEHQKAISERAKFEDVWSGRRIVASGRIEYDRTNGSICRVHASKIRLLEAKPVELLTDSDFTDGLRASDYLDSFREGNLG